MDKEELVEAEIELLFTCMCPRRTSLNNHLTEAFAELEYLHVQTIFAHRSEKLKNLDLDSFNQIATISDAPSTCNKDEHRNKLTSLFRQLALSIFHVFVDSRSELLAKCH